MQHTLVAVFDNRGDAQKALDELLNSGYSRAQARLSEGDPVGETSLSPESTISHSSAEDPGAFVASLRNFFTNVFGTDRSEDARIYSEAVHRGHYVLTVSADSLTGIEHAADLVERFGPIDIDEHAQQWRGGPGMQRPGSGAVQRSGPMSQQRAGETAIPPGQEERKAGTREVERGGVRIYQRVVETPVNESLGLRRTEVELEQLAPADDAYFRGHWTSTYASQGGVYEEYALAYSYGSTMAGSDLYRGRPWGEVENNLRSDWEARNPDSAWEKVKAAIRHGWERMTS